MYDSGPEILAYISQDALIDQFYDNFKLRNYNNLFSHGVSSQSRSVLEQKPQDIGQESQSLKIEEIVELQSVVSSNGQNAPSSSESLFAQSNFQHSLLSHGEPPVVEMKEALNEESQISKPEEVVETEPLASATPETDSALSEPLVVQNVLEDALAIHEKQPVITAAQEASKEETEQPSLTLDPGISTGSQLSVRAEPQEVIIQNQTSPHAVKQGNDLSIVAADNQRELSAKETQVFTSQNHVYVPAGPTLVRDRDSKKSKGEGEELFAEPQRRRGAQK